jgi:hypothetical protein
MSITESLFETTEGKITLVDLPPTTRPFEIELRDQMAKAKAANEKLVLFVVSDACRPCLSIAAMLPTPVMQQALQRARLVRVSITASRADLEGIGVQTQLIPGFYLLGNDLRPHDGITGGEWDDDTAENAAPVLGAFVRGALAKRRHPFVPQPRRAFTPRAPTTLLLPSAVGRPSPPRRARRFGPAAHPPAPAPPGQNSPVSLRYRARARPEPPGGTRQFRSESRAPAPKPGRSAPGLCALASVRAVAGLVATAC